MVVETRIKKRIPSGNSVSDGGESSNSVEGLRTYKRRKTCDETPAPTRQDDDANTRLFAQAAGQLSGKETKQQQDQAVCSSSQENNVLSRVDTLPSHGSDDVQHGQWRNIVLQHVSQSLEVNEGGIGSCIQDALASSLFSTDVSEQAAESQKCLNCHDDKIKDPSQTQNDPEITSENLNGAEVNVDAALDISAKKKNGPDNVHVTERCQRVLRGVVVSEEFTMFCKLLCEHFQGIKVDKLSEFNTINSRMREGVYGHSPMLFSADIQKLWRSFQMIGTEMASLAKGLLDMSKKFYREEVQKLEVGGSVNGTYMEENEVTNHFNPRKVNCLGSHTTKRYPSVESETLCKQDHAEVSGLQKICTCRHCGNKAEGRDCLVCDSCEEMYHVSCVGLPGGCIPTGSWFCNNCFDARLMSAHENCVVCERIKNSKAKTHLGDETEPITNAAQENSGCCMRPEDVYAESSKRIGCTCKLCGCDLKEDGEFLICMHPQCPNKYYHERCLTSQQLKSYGPRWYCPSCLCRKCLTDRDDDKVVLCDGCDHAYHIYCMNPPCSSIPRGKWFCRLCEKRIRAIRKAKMMYENLGKRKNTLGVNTSAESLDILVSAVEKLKYEEKLASAAEKK